LQPLHGGTQFGLDSVLVGRTSCMEAIFSSPPVWAARF
jgi:hypothetical protein